MCIPLLYVVVVVASSCQRFVFDFTLLQRVKLQHEVVFDRILDMTPFLMGGEKKEEEKECKYHLFAILMHSGTAMGGELQIIFLRCCVSCGDVLSVRHVCAHGDCMCVPSVLYI
jgi:hypothetical protein